MNQLYAHVEIKGSLTFSQDLLLEGRVLGDVFSTACLIIGEEAFVQGTINTRSVIISGRVEGDIHVQERCEVKSTATVLGNITSATFVIEAGASFCGRSQIGSPQPKSPLLSSSNNPPKQRPRVI
ncbi:MAG: polymer-forming cytoskeletal protein [Verrucomicrobia bacterium]|nr:polymer-forming cytoskeletal protein [Verrucomicrobiota bacterium]